MYSLAPGTVVGSPPQQRTGQVLCSRYHKTETRYWKNWVSCLEVCRNISSLSHSSCWQNPFPCSCRTGSPFPCWLSVRVHFQFLQVVWIPYHVIPSIFKANYSESSSFWIQLTLGISDFSLSDLQTQI